MAFTHKTLTDQLTGQIREPFDIEDVHEMPNRTTADGRPFLTRDRLIATYERRQQSARQRRSLTEMMATIQTLLTNLRAAADTEVFFSWVLRSNGKRVYGFSTDSRLLVVFPDSFTERGDADE